MPSTERHSHNAGIGLGTYIDDPHTGGLVSFITLTVLNKQVHLCIDTFSQGSCLLHSYTGIGTWMNSCEMNNCMQMMPFLEKYVQGLQQTSGSGLIMANMRIENKSPWVKSMVRKSVDVNRVKTGNVKSAITMRVPCRFA